METRELISRIATLRGRVRRLLALHGLGWVVGLTVPLMILACLTDWLAHLDAGVRLTFLLALTGSAGWLAYRHVVVPLIVRFGNLDIALRIEERWPGLNDRLASTVQFLEVADDDDRFGSRALREATVRQTLAETESMDFREVVETRPTKKALALAAGALALASAFLVAEPGLSRIAARRLFLPFGSDRWPQMTHLTLLDRETPRKIARGEPFALAVAVAQGDRIPSSARAAYRFDDGETLVEPLRAVEGGVFRGRIETVERSFKFSVSAGDDSTSVRDVAVAVVPPPTINDLTIRLVPPEYTKQGPLILAPGKTQVKAVEGTRVELEAQTNKPIALAALRLGEGTGPEPVTWDVKKTRLKVAFTLKGSNPFWFELLDTEGFRNREAVRYEARGVADEAPRVVIDQPTNDREIPSRAVVPVTFTADDDFGLHSARLVYKTASGGSEPTREVILPLWSASETPEGPPVRHQTVEYAWDIAPLKLPAGSVITFHADARDFDSIKGPNLGKSRELRLRIATDQEIAARIEEAQREMREDVERILQMQNQARLPVDEAARSLARTDQIGKTVPENLKNAEMIQRQVSNRITNKVDGLQEKIDRSLADLKNFRLPNPDAQKQMEEMRAGVSRIRENNLDPAEQGLTRASKNVNESLGEQSSSTPEAKAPDSKDAAGRDGPKPDASRTQAKTNPGASKPAGKSAADASKTKAGKDGAPNREEQRQAASAPSKDQGRRPLDLAKEGLAQAQTNQKAITDELKKMLDSLSEFENVRGAVKDAQNLLKEQEQVMKQSSDAASKPELMGKTPEQLNNEQKADLANLAARQSNVAKESRNLQEKLDQMAKRTAESDPTSSAALKEAADQLAKQGTSARAGEAADQLEKNQMGAARGNQEQTREDLKDVVDALQNRRERELARLIRDLKAAENDLAKLRERQTQNLAKTRAAQKKTDPQQRSNELKRLAKEQAEIQKELERQLKRLAKLNAESAAKAGAKAAGKMGKAQQGLEQGEGEQADKDQDDALADLEDAQDKVNQARKEAEEQLAMEQFSKMGDRLRALAEREEKIATDTVSYEQLRTQRAGKLTIAQRTGVRNLAGIQEALQDETAELIERLEGAPVFALTLKRASAVMETAAQRLQALKTDELTQRAARSAAARFKQLLDALKPDKPKNAGGQQKDNGGEGGGGGGGGDGIPPAAQLKMLKALQEEINERTDFLDEVKRRGKELSPDQVSELDKLTTDQGTLADLVRDLTKPKSDDAEE